MSAASAYFYRHEGRYVTPEEMEAIRGRPVSWRRYWLVDGEYLDARGMARRSGVPLQRIRNRLGQGMTPEKAMSRVESFKRKPDIALRVFGESLSVNELAELARLHPHTIYRRIAQGMTPEQAAFAPSVVARELKTCAAPGCTNKVRAFDHRFCSQACVGKARTKARPQRTCAAVDCTNVLPITATRKYCSDLCRQRTRRLLPTSRKCRGCGRTFTPKRVDRHFCSQSCGVVSYQKRHRLRPLSVNCEECKKPFEPKHKAQRFCSYSCGMAARRRGAIKLKPRVCVYAACRKTFYSPALRQSYCSLACRKLERVAKRRALADAANGASRSERRIVRATAINETRVALQASAPPSGAKWIVLSDGERALVDESDYERATCLLWCHTKHPVRGRVYENVVNGKTTLANYLLGLPVGVLVNHRNGDMLDNRRDNLRPASHTQQARSARKRAGSATSKYKGVWLMRASRKSRMRSDRYYAGIRVNGKLIHLGSFKDEIEAARAYDDAARQHFQEFATLNFPRDGEIGALKE